MNAKIQNIDFEKLFQSSSLASLLISTSDMEYTILAQNKSHAVLTGTKAGDVVGKSLFKVFPGIIDGVKQKDLADSPIVKTLSSVNKTDKTEIIDEIRYDITDKSGHVFRKFWRVYIDPVDKDLDIISLSVEDITRTKLQAGSLNLLSHAGRQFSASLRYTQTLHNIASLVVPDVADWCTIDLLREDGQIEQVVLIHKDPKQVAWGKKLQSQQGAPDPKAPTGVPHVIRTGKPEHIPVITAEMIEALSENSEQLELARSLNFSSVMIVPLIIDGRTIGAMSLVSTESRRHYDKDDLDIAMSLAERAALAVYNANLYQSARKELNERKKLQFKIESINEGLEDLVKQRTLELEAVNCGLEDEINKRELAEVDLVRSNEDLQNFAYVASHDLQEPLRKIQAFGNLLSSEYGEKLDGGRDYLDRMLNASTRMSTLIDDLLAFSRVSIQSMSKSSVDLNQIVSEVLDDIETLVSEDNAKIKCDKLPTVKADATHMRQLFQNLISNAIKFRKPGTQPKIVITCKEDGKFHEISITDNGIGFDEKYLDRIFTVFQRLHGREAYSGTGIGLAVCQKIVQRYGGIITAKSQPGQGSTFIIKLP